jgi:hypothetical protein
MLICVGWLPVSSKLESIVRLSMRSLRPLIVVVKVFVAVKLRELRSFGKNEWIVIKGNWLDHVH